MTTDINTSNVHTEINTGAPMGKDVRVYTEAERKECFMRQLKLGYMHGSVHGVVRSAERTYQLNVHVNHFCTVMTANRFAFYTEEIEKATADKVFHILNSGLLKPVMDMGSTPTKEEFFALFIEKLAEHKFVFVDYYYLRSL